jgi:hypothetical protein
MYHFSMPIPLKKLCVEAGAMAKPPRLRQIYDIHMGLLIIYFLARLFAQGSDTDIHIRNKERKKNTQNPRKN